MESFTDFYSIFEHHLESEILEDESLLNKSSLFQGDMSFYYVLLMSEMTTKHFIILSIITITSVLFVVPSNLWMVIVIIRNKTLWTPSNIVLTINGIIQCIGASICLVLRPLLVHGLFLLPMQNSYKESIYLAAWWTYVLMMRTGNNRLVCEDMEIIKFN